MHPTAKRCVQWAVGLVLVGTAAIVFGTELVIRASEHLGQNGALAFWLIDYVIGGIRLFAVPIAAALVAAAVVVQALAPARDVADTEAAGPDAGEPRTP
ncbi:hypothetical protein [Demequina rhizosphaerae]|uniref:hypothetical protein n=1 Tax=Demequina rhizosphaerae TaxID=1638985 RepID=UPI000785374A|nr:hypothetical protein [Demequina rhizosphaerae]